MVLWAVLTENKAQNTLHHPEPAAPTTSPGRPEFQQHAELEHGERTLERAPVRLD